MSGDSGQMRVKAFILSIDGEVRSSSLIPALDELSFPYEIVKNGNVSDALDFWKENGSESYKRRDLTDNQRSCTYGHRLMYESSMRDRGDWDYFLFLEDDVILDINLARLLFANKWLFSPPFVLLGSCGGWAYRRHKTLGKTTSCFKVFSDSICGSHAYVANRVGVDALFRGTQSLDRLADAFFRVPRIPMHIVFPFVAFQEGLSQSTIPLHSGDGSRKFFRRFLSSLFNDLLDFFYYSKFGIRVLRLSELERFFLIFLKKLPGCNYQDSQSD
jgi:hypothetical protein